MIDDELPPSAAWRHCDARDGFETVFASGHDGGRRLEGITAAVEDGVAWAVHYRIVVDARWHTRSAHVWCRAADGERSVTVGVDADSRWQVDGQPVPELDGCLDVDLEASACTNTFPVHRLGLAVGAGVDAPAAYVRAPGLEVVRLDQRYERLPDGSSGERYHYLCPAFDADYVLDYDTAGLIVTYPGLAERVG